MKEPLVYIIILNWNGHKDTVECIESLQRIEYKNYKIVIVDNGSTDNSASVLKTKFPDTSLIVNKKNLGFSGGCNVGIKYALRKKADYILFLNNDTFVDKNFLSNLVETAESKNKVGIISPKIYYADKPNMIFSMGGFKNYKGSYPFIDYETKKIDTGQYENIEERDCVTGCCILIDKNIFKEVGMFDDEYFLYVEDMDFSIRVKNAGYKIFVCQKSKIWHKVSGSSGGEGNPVKEYYNNRNLILFARKNLTFEKNEYLFNLIKGRLVKTLFYLKNGKFKNAFAIWHGILDGMLGKKGV